MADNPGQQIGLLVLACAAAALDRRVCCDMIQNAHIRIQPPTTFAFSRHFSQHTLFPPLFPTYLSAPRRRLHGTVAQVTLDGLRVNEDEVMVIENGKRM